MKYVNAIVNAVRAYTQKAFITYYIDGELDTNNLPELIPGIWEIRGSNFNDGFYYVEDDSITDILVDEVFEGYLVYIKLPLDDGLVESMEKAIEQNRTYGLVRRQQVGDSSYTLDTGSGKKSHIGGIPVSILSTLDHYRQLPGGLERDYQRAGII